MSKEEVRAKLVEMGFHLVYSKVREDWYFEFHYASDSRFFTFWVNELTGFVNLKQGE